MMRAVLLTSVLAGATPAYADQFESKAANAQRLNRIENLVWALTAPCDAGDDTHKRQCRRVRDKRAGELAGATLLVDAEPEAFQIGTWSAKKKSLPLTLSACIRCSGVEIDGKKYFVAARKAGGGAPKLAGGKLKAGMLSDTARQFADENVAKLFAKNNANARVQLIVKVPAKPKTVVGGKPAISLELIGYRVFSPCDGSIILATPISAPVAADAKQCSAISSPASGPEVDALTAPLINEAMKPVVEAANECFAKYGVAGKAKLKLTVGSDGAVVKHDQQGDFDGTPTGQCIDAAVMKAAFPRSKKPKTSISYPINLQ